MKPLSCKMLPHGKVLGDLWMFVCYSLQHLPCLLTVLSIVTCFFKHWFRILCGACISDLNTYWSIHKSLLNSNILIYDAQERVKKQKMKKFKRKWRKYRSRNGCFGTWWIFDQWGTVRRIFGCITLNLTWFPPPSLNRRQSAINFLWCPRSLHSPQPPNPPPPKILWSSPT